MLQLVCGYEAATIVSDALLLPVLAALVRNIRKAITVAGKRVTYAWSQ